MTSLSWSWGRGCPSCKIWRLRWENQVTWLRRGLCQGRNLSVLVMNLFYSSTKH